MQQLFVQVDKDERHTLRISGRLFDDHKCLSFSLIKSDREAYTHTPCARQKEVTISLEALTSDGPGLACRRFTRWALK